MIKLTVTLPQIATIEINPGEVIRAMILKDGLRAVIESVRVEAETLADPTSDGGTGAECYFGLNGLDAAITELESWSQS